jgi:S-DNA-T family DNA segregation ATPase FtsK/SpoIIIE
MVDRARTALRGEQERRQRLLRDAGDLDSIAGYQRLRSMDQRLEPLPRLLVVVDEFGELLGAHPEFLDLLTAIGRTGRSLGIHLLLASQRMEEGRLRGLDSHLRYRICLRTSSAADSAAVLGAPDAYHLPPSPGNGLLGVDGGPCQRFKGLLVSTSKVGPPDPGGATGPSPALVLPFDPIAGPAAHPPVDGAPSLPRAATVLGEWSACRPPAGTVPDRGSPDGAGPTDLDVVVSALAPLARAGRRSHPIWLPPLPATITLGEVVQSAGEWPGPGDPAWLRVPVGTVDRPFDQCQEPLMLDFTGGLGHLAIAGAPRSGKSTLLATLVAAFALTHRPDSAQFYCVDLGGGLLHELACLPHVGAVLGSHEPTEVRRLVRALHSLVTTRERSFRRHGISSMAAWHARRDTDRALAQDGYGEVFLMVDNWSRLRQELEDLEPEIEALAGAGLHYGVHLVVAANRWADLRLALRDNVGGRLELRLNDPIESEVGRAAAARLPELPGRGLTPEGHQFQVALPVLGTGERDHHLASGPARAPGAARPTRPPPIAVREIARRAVRSPTGAKAPPHLPLPALLPVEDLSQRAAVPVEAASRTAEVRAEDLFASAPGPATGAERAVGIPFALHEHRLEVVRLDLATAPHFLVLGDAESGRTATLRCLARGLMACHPPGELRLLVVDYRRTLMDLMDAPHCESYASAPSMAAEVAARLRALLDRRLPGSAVRRTEARRWSGPRFVMVVDDYDLVADAGPNPLGPLLDLLGQGRDIGLHVLLARPVSGAARSSFEPFYQRVRETGSPGLILSGDPREGPLLGGRAAAAQPPGRGYLVTRQGRSGLVQVAWTPPGPPTGPGALPGSTPPPHQVPPPTPPAPSAAGAMDDPVWSGPP